MKKKHDFITNSSSCSFIAWGLSMDMSELKEKCGPTIFKLAKEKEAKKAKENGAIMAMSQSKEDIKKEYEKWLDQEDFFWEVECLLEGLEMSQMPYEDIAMIGKSPFSQKNDETLNDFKQRICDGFKVIGLELKPNDLYQIEEAWMDN